MKQSELKDVLDCLYSLQNPEKVLFKQKKFGIAAQNSLGVYHKDLKIIAREIGRNNELAIELFNTGIYEARLLCSKIFNPKDLTEDLMKEWVVTFENWEICDSFCMGLFAKSKLAVPKIIEWQSRDREFEKRACFATMAAYCMADKFASNSMYESFLPLIIKASSDERLYVKKAVNWALRSIGKRNRDLNLLAISTANQILEQNTKPAIWIANNAIKELKGEKLNILDYPRSIYRK